MNTKAQIGVANLAFLGENLVLNMAEKGMHSKNGEVVIEIYFLAGQ